MASIEEIQRITGAAAELSGEVVDQAKGCEMHLSAAQAGLIALRGLLQEAAGTADSAFDDYEQAEPPLRRAGDTASAVRARLWNATEGSRDADMVNDPATRLDAVTNGVADGINLDLKNDAVQGSFSKPGIKRSILNALDGIDYMLAASGRRLEGVGNIDASAEALKEAVEQFNSSR